MNKAAVWATRVMMTLLLGLLAVVGCSQKQNRYDTRFLAFGTLMDLAIVGIPTDQAEQAARIIEADFLQMHKSWHAWDPGPLGHVNKMLETGETFSAPPSVLPLVRLGKSLSIQSEGLFNPAIGHLIDAWGFHRNDPSGGRPPPPETIAQLLHQNPSMLDIEIDGLSLQGKNPAVKLDFGAFGKGYGIDLAVEHLKKMGIQNAIVNAGGDLRAIGRRETGDPWKIAIRDPDGQNIVGILEISGDESVFTSGNYERNFTWEGKRYHHIIDPRTGYPAEGTASVTVIHNDSTVADAAATALFVAGPEDWHRIARKMGIRYVLLIAENGDFHMNPAMQSRLKLTDETDRKIILSAPLN
ncbi:MAG: FAD:protein FMN transferase [Gammaproteobacteria bacterium]|nr:FAD:protein FMN transferase [Gammaproteobacteria bacterium]HXK55079.1 FAD:protein FMN transferase [Gammaproteobacteria bacterium]